MEQKKIVISNKVINQNPLLWPKQGNFKVDKRKKNIFLGIGVAGPKRLSQAVPFDELGFIMTAEFLRQLIPEAHVFLLIADQHAWLANNMEKGKAKKIANLQLKTLKKVIGNFGFNNWHLFLASQLFPETQPSSYETLEKRDVNHFFSHHNTGIKLGWKFTDSENHITDEAHFDTGLDKKKIKSIFIKPGLTLDIKQLHESPYICTNPKKRVLLSRKENVTRKLESIGEKSNQSQAVGNQLKKIALLFEKVVIPLPAKTRIGRKARMIIKLAFK